VLPSPEGPLAALSAEAAASSPDAWAAVVSSAVSGGQGAAVLSNGRGSLWRAYGESGH
jgi:hypothetical protein